MDIKAWLLLVTNLPGANQTLRMRVWRGLKASGAASLRDGVYLLPTSPAARRVFGEAGDQIRKGGGITHILPIDSEGESQGQAFAAMFDRTPDYAEIKQRIDALLKDGVGLSEAEARRRLAVVRRDVSTVNAIDFFPGAACAQLEHALADAEGALNAQFSPDEPHALRRHIKRLDRTAYQGRTWATREHLWIDRVCSAWLIRRFIDPKAKFLWLKRIKDCPRRAVGFDFDGAEFSHISSKITFEVLVESFGLDQDHALARLGSLVHYLDVGGVPVAEATGLAALMAGNRALCRDDDALLKASTPALDAFYAAFSSATEDAQR